jgi:hypothetical protein
MRRKLFKYSIALLTMAMLIACSKVPRDVLSERKMKDVLIDMLLAENIMSENYKAYIDSTSKAALYQSVFRKHNITQAVYDSSLVWYGKNLDVLIEVYDLATYEVNERIRDLGDVQASAAPSAGRDSVDVWPRRNYMTLQPGALFNGTVFSIRPEGPYPSGSSFVLGLRVWGLTDKMRHTPAIRIAAELTDTTLVVNETLRTEGYHALTLKTPATKAVRRIYGYIRMDNAETGYYKIYIDSLSLVRYNYGSKALP